MLWSIITEYSTAEVCQHLGVLHELTEFKQGVLCGYSFPGTGLTLFNEGANPLSADCNLAVLF